jgi:hypothetical protein
MAPLKYKVRMRLGMEKPVLIASFRTASDACMFMIDKFNMIPSRYHNLKGTRIVITLAGRIFDKKEVN